MMMNDNDEQALTKALSALSVERDDAENENVVHVAAISSGSAQGSSALKSSNNNSNSIKNDDETSQVNNKASGIDLALVDAMRTTRDKLFVCKHEKEMEEMIRNDEVTEWELPLMNSYQRLLVHRIADHFNLAHLIDPTTRHVTLSKIEGTRIPEESISVLAERERISDPVPFPPLLNSLSGQSTPSSGSGITNSAPLRIMRRDAANAASRSDSPRNGTNTPDEGGSIRKDRKNMTMEEREAAYREARQRIFGNDGSNDSNVDQSSEQASVQSACQNRREMMKSGSSRSTTPYSNTSDANVAGPSSRHSSLTGDNHQTGSMIEESYQDSPQIFQDPHTGLMRMPSSGSTQGSNVAMDPQYGQAPYYGYTAYGWPAVQQTDPYGRPLINYGQQQYFPDQHASHTASPYGDQSYSSGISSRSTSLSTSVDGIESTRSSLSDQYASQSITNQTNGAPLITNPVHLQQHRSQSVSPTVPMTHRSPPSSGNHTPGGSFIYQQNVLSPPPLQNQQTWNVGYLQNGYPSAYPSPVSPMEQGRNGVSNATANGVIRSPLGFNGPSGIYNPAYGHSGIQSNSTPPAPYFNGVPVSQQMVSTGLRNDENVYQVSGRGRGRVSQGSERSLYDPNKPTLSNQSSSASGNGRHAINKSSSAAAVLELSQGQQQRRDGLLNSQILNSSTSSRAITPSEESIRRSASSNVRNGTTSPSSTISTSTASSFVNHPSLPARPDWVIPEKPASISSQISTIINGNAKKSTETDEVGTPEPTNLS